jgi:cyclopropane-fatty-acyl-phospholipid synthase
VRGRSPGGACIQSITINDKYFQRYVTSTDFIQQYIFPGGLLPSPGAFREAAARSGLRVVNELDFGLDYAETLRRWREKFLGEESRIRRCLTRASCASGVLPRLLRAVGRPASQFTLQRD